MGAGECGIQQDSAFGWTMIKDPFYFGSHTYREVFPGSYACEGCLAVLDNTSLIPPRTCSKPDPILLQGGHFYSSADGVYYHCTLCRDQRTIHWMFAGGSINSCPKAVHTSRPVLSVPACECGAAAVGIQSYAVGHSSWCEVAPL